MLYVLEKCNAGLETDGIEPHCDVCDSKQSTHFFCRWFDSGWFRGFLCGRCAAKVER